MKATLALLNYLNKSAYESSYCCFHLIIFQIYSQHCIIISAWDVRYGEVQDYNPILDIHFIPAYLKHQSLEKCITHNFVNSYADNQNLSVGSLRCIAVSRQFDMQSTQGGIVSYEMQIKDHKPIIVDYFVAVHEHSPRP